VSSLVLDRVEKGKKDKKKKTIRNNNKKWATNSMWNAVGNWLTRWQFKDEPHEI
jgi:hypothetical protein